VAQYQSVGQYLCLDTDWQQADRLAELGHRRLKKLQAVEGWDFHDNDENVDVVKAA